MYFYDLETCIMQRGYKRADQLIMEIGACSAYDPSKTFRCFVNPTDQILTRENFMDIFIAHGAREYATRTHAKNIKYSPAEAVPIREALYNFLCFINQSGPPTICAHNGRAFDDPIVSGALKRTGLQWPKDTRFIDSYHDIARKVWPARRSYKLQVLHRNFCPENSDLRWHTALDDSIGLSHVVTAAARQAVADNIEASAKYIEIEYGTDKFNREFSCKLPPRFSSKIGKHSRAALKRKILTGPTSVKLNALCITICLGTLWP